MVPFSKNQVTDQSSDLSDTAVHCLNYYGMFLFGMSELYRLTDRIAKICLHFVSMKNG